MRTLQAPLSTAILDSGTTYTYLPSAAYRALRGANEAHCSSHDCGATRKSKCWLIKEPESASNVNYFPRVEVIFGDVGILWPPSAYLYRKGESALWCYSFEDDGPRAQATCPQYRERPAHARPPALPWLTRSISSGTWAIWVFAACIPIMICSAVYRQCSGGGQQSGKAKVTKVD